MPILRTVEAWPATKFPDRAWSTDPDVDAFLGSSRAVFEVFGEELAGARVKAGAAGIRFFPNEPAASEDEFRIDLDPEFFPYAFDFGRITVPRGFSALGKDDQAWASLEVIRTGVLELGRLRGWDVSPLEAVREQVVGRGLRYTSAGAWKSSPGRRHQARCSFRIASDGLGRVQLQVRAVADRKTVARTDEAVAFTTMEGLKRSAATLRWRDRDVVTVVPWCGLTDSDYRGMLGVDLRSGAPLAPEVLVAPAAAPGQLPAVRVHWLSATETGSPDPDTDPVPCLWWDGERGHPWPPAYIHEAHRVVDLLGRNPGYEQWWSSTPFQTLLVRMVLHTGEPDPPAWTQLERWPKAGTRKVGLDLRLTVLKHAEELPESRDATVQRAVARQDIHRALVHAARQRGFPDPPPLPDRVFMTRAQWHAAQQPDYPRDAAGADAP